MRKINRHNLRKTIYYLKKNGMKNTVLAAVERLQHKEQDDYTFTEPSMEELCKQRETAWEQPVVFSIVVPVYHTPENYFREMVESVLNQTYPHFELILADAGETEELRALADGYNDARIRYIKLAENAGISENTNRGFEAAAGDYIALLDHDDLLTKDALYEMAAAIEEEKNRGREAVLLYSDEDKCDGEGQKFYDPHLKQDFNLDLLLTNNYFCHFTAAKADVVKRLKERRQYDGAQDFDLVLRAVEEVLFAKEGEQEPEDANKRAVIVHIPKILYHWRCHISSTAANPESKRYAYEAGKRAVEDFVSKRGWKAKVEHLKHLGFYRVVYEGSIFDSREDVAAVGGRILGKNRKIIGGMMKTDGSVVFAGLRDGFSGYVNRAALVQEAPLLDIRCMQINPQCYAIFESVAGIPCQAAESGIFDWKKLPAGTDYTELSKKICEALHKEGYRLLWDPQVVEVI